MKILDTKIPDCYELKCRVLSDERGSFTKIFHFNDFANLGLRTDWEEEYYSRSGRDVIRGMHFQTPPKAHAKLVHCYAGEVLDVVLDLRKGSPTFAEYQIFNLSPETGNGIYVPPGCAHGFLSLVENSIVHYKVTSIFSPENDKGILWSSFGFDWPVLNPVISKRDQKHPALSEFDSPFLYEELLR